MLLEPVQDHIGWQQEFVFDVSCRFELQIQL